MMKGKRTTVSAVLLRSSFSRASFLPVLPQDQANVAEQMAVLEGKELTLYMRKIKTWRGK